MKYIEQVKSVILLLLILLSLTLTFTIWTYSPSYDTIETPIVNISIAEKKKMEDVVKPYRILYSQEETLNGSITSPNIEKVLSSLKKWEIQTVELLNNKASFQQINDYIKTPNRITLFYPAEVPLKTFSTILSFADPNLPDASFNRLVIEWNGKEDDEMKLYFINTLKQKVYTSRADKVDKKGFTDIIIKQASNLPEYNEIERPGKLSLYVTNNPEDMMSYTYILEEIAPEKFKNALFSSPGLVRSNSGGSSGQQYTDDSALMNVDFLYKRLSYVNPAAESENPAKPDELIQNSLNFINEHDGWTDDYRYNRINPLNQQVSYQLYFSGLQVLSSDTWTEITQYWGLNRVYRYIRPYYMLNGSSSIKTSHVQLPSGQSTYDLISKIPDASLIEDIIICYYLSRDDHQDLVKLDPSWYYLINGTWTRVSPEILGGGKLGLE
ncbi:YycH family regulatory protein [Psychrobacillus vulpis]|uniref:YycH family regulatory protein n=1 Tax=Psychrobacillus vulpis TaxID=2325572 RepID=UPI0014084E21|nr:two-component system activity regulator YycH [Psychrobacillus vulpis]